MKWLNAMRLWLDQEPPSMLPAHVRAVRLCPQKMALHIASADRPSLRTQSGFVKPRTEEMAL